MKVGLIPPRGLENFALRSKFHLALAIPELMARRVYSGMYKRAGSSGDYVVLDNGLAEGVPATPTQIITYAEQLRANEIVLPDAMKESVRTVELVERFFKGNVPLNYNYMAVAQGESTMEFCYCIDKFVMMPFVTVIGLPRHMLETLNVAVRIDLANWITDNYPGRFEIHFLGTNPVWLGEVKSTVKYAPFVRSVDTSMPFSYAFEGEDLAKTTRRITRPPKYFDSDWSSKAPARLIRNNINTLLEWASESKAPASGVREVSAS